MDGTKKKALAVVLAVAVFFVGIVVGQQSYSSRINYSITAEVSISLLSPLNLGNLQSPSEGSKMFLEALEIRAFKEGYVVLTFSFPQSNLTKLVNQFNVFRVSIRNSGGEYAYIDLMHTTDSYTLATPQTWYANVFIEWNIKEGIEDADGTAFLNLEVT